MAVKKIKAGVKDSGKYIGVNIISYRNRMTKPKLDEEVGLDIGPDEILIECSKKLILNSLLTLKILLAFASRYEVIQTPAKILWVKRSLRKTYYINCGFTNLMPKDKKILSQYLKAGRNNNK